MSAHEDAARVLEEAGHSPAQLDASGLIGTDGCRLLPSIHEGCLRVVYRFHWSWNMDGQQGRRKDADLDALHTSRLDAYTTALQEHGWTVEQKKHAYIGDSYLLITPPANAACGHCKGEGGDPDEEGDWDPVAHRHNPTTRPPCPVCNGTGLKTTPEN